MRILIFVSLRDLRAFVVGEIYGRAWERIRAGADDPIDWGALAYTIHTLYGVAENYFSSLHAAFRGKLVAIAEALR